MTRDTGTPSDRATGQELRSGDVVRVERIGLWHWRAWSAALPNPRGAFSAAGARRRIQADLDHEWRTGRVARGQRSPR